MTTSRLASPTTEPPGPRSASGRGPSPARGREVGGSGAPRGRPRGAVVALAILCVVAPGPPPARADEGTGFASTDAVAKERENDFEELQKKKGTQAANQRLEILRGLAFAPCVTARRFLLGLLKKSSTTGDERAEAVRTLLHIADEDAFAVVLATLARDRDPTLYQVVSEGLQAARSPAVQTWVKGPALASRDLDLVGAYLDAPLPRDADVLAKIEGLYAKPQKPAGAPDTAARALRALAVARGAAERARLLEAVRHPDPRVRLVAADSIPGLEPFDADLEAAVRTLLQDESAAVRQAAAARAGAAKRAGVLPALVTMLADPRLRSRHVAASALKEATGQAFGQDPKAWSAWLAKEDPGRTAAPTFPTYHGFAVETDRVLFLVDASSSMTWPWSKTPHRIDVARSELASVLRQLTPETQFNVVVYADERAWFRKAPVAATPENASAAVAWAEKALAEPKGDTRMFEALEAAFASDPQFDTIFLLTDGNPTAGRYWAPANLVAAVRAWNRHRRAAIHAIGLSLLDEDRGRPNLSEDPQAMAALLSGLAGATGGQYREILKAPAAK